MRLGNTLEIVIKGAIGIMQYGNGVGKGQDKRHYFDPHFALQNALLMCRRRLVKFRLGVLGCWDVKSHDVRFYCVEMGKRKALSAVHSQAVWFPCAEKGKQKAVFDVQSHAVCFSCAETGRRKAVCLLINLRLCACSARNISAIS